MASVEERIRKDGSVSYLVKVHKGRDPITKRQLTPYVTTWEPENPKWSPAKVQKELNKFVVQYENDCKNGKISTNKSNFYDYATYVIGIKERNGLKHNTIINYRSMLENIKDQIGFLRLDKIYPSTLNGLYEWLATQDFDGDGKPIGAKTVREYHAMISSIYTFALKEGATAENPANRASPPKPPKKDVNYLQMDTVEALLESMHNEPVKWQAIINIALLSGARRGEIVGLKWKKVDFVKNIITIDTTLLYSKDRGIYESTTKTNQIRSVALPPETMAILKNWKDVQENERLINGDRWVGGDYVFTGDAGKPLHPDSVTTYLARLSKRYNLPHINPHALRHTHGSMLSYNGADVVSISKRLGHASVSTTMNIYMHAMQEADARAAQIAGQAIYKK